MKKILIIEDEQVLQKTLSDALKKEGYKVLLALDGDSGLKIAKKENPDLILLDIILPKKTGFEILAELKKDPSTKDISVIILTNLEEAENIEKALILGATTYLIKMEYSLSSIIEKVKKTIEK